MASHHAPRTIRTRSIDPDWDRLIWLAAVAVPHLIAGTMDAEMGSVLFSVSLVVVVIAVTPLGYVWQRYVTAAGDPWR